MMSSGSLNGDNPRPARPGLPGKKRMVKHDLAPLASLAMILLLTACTTPLTPLGSDRDAGPPWQRAKPTKDAASTTEAAGIAATGAADAAEPARLYKGTGQLVKGQLPGGALPAPGPRAIASGPSVSLNFDGAD